MHVRKRGARARQQAHCIRDFAVLSESWYAMRYAQRLLLFIIVITIIIIIIIIIIIVIVVVAHLHLDSSPIYRLLYPSQEEGVL